MLFSILIPTYNNERTIAKAIDSALNQDYDGEYEIVIVNNASTDSTLSVIESYSDSKIKVISNLSTVHMYENHNICIQNAEGDYVIFCHSDDELYPEALKILANKIKERMFPLRYVVWGHSMFRDFCKELHKNTRFSLNTMFSGEIAKQIFLDSAVTPSGTCFRRDSMLRLGGFPVIMDSYDMDWAFEVIAAFNGWEFEMMDRMVYKREFASTYISCGNNARLCQLKKAAEYVYNNLNIEQREEVKKYWQQYHYVHFDTYFLPNPITKDKRLQLIWLRYKERPWCVWKIFKWILIKWNIWK